MRISLREKIFREIVANMLVHREYTNAYPSLLVIYKDRVETKNANRPHLYGQLLPDNFEPFPKNPHIIQLFTQIGRCEELGTGIRNVYKYSKAYSGEDNIGFEEKDIFIAQVPLGDIFADKKANEDCTKDCTKYCTKEILHIISQNPEITTTKLAEEMSVARRTIANYINILKKENKIVRVNGKKHGYWKISTKKDDREHNE
jgi:ATP-dependent DNA helicase RecG